MKPALKGLIALLVVSLVLLAIVNYGSKIVQGFEDKNKGYGETNERGTFTMYYADWCPHCQTAKPLFAEFMGKGVLDVDGKKVRVEMIEEKQLKNIPNHPDIKGFPSFLYSDAAGRIVEYDGPRTPEGFMQFLKEKILS